MTRHRHISLAACGALLAAAVLACGRTQLDQPFADGGETAGTAGTGGGGTSGAAGAGGGAAGAGGGAAAGRGGTGGGSAGTGVAGRGSGGTGATGGAAPLACGQTSCTPGVQTCCIGANGPTCVGASQSCSGISIGCVDRSACGAGLFCCFTLLDASSMCDTALACGPPGLSAILCRRGADCPSSAANCCPFGGSGLCRAQACP